MASKWVERIMAWKRLEDNGITFSLDVDDDKPFIQIHSRKEKGSIQEVLNIVQDLYLLFGGEE